jgi:enoyl-CoA hydratase/carnithine racemase
VGAAIGLIAGGGGISRLARLMGRSRALEAMLGCDDFDADLAERYGWINRALPAAELDAFVDRLARRIASFPPHAIAATKEAVLQRAEPDAQAAIYADHDAATPLVRRPEARRAMTAFLRAGGQTVEGEQRFAELMTVINGDA